MSTATSHDIVTRIARRMAEAVGPRRYAMWFDRSARFTYGDQTLRVSVPNRFVAERIREHFREQLRDVARQETGEEVALDLQIAPDRFAGQRPGGESAGGSEAEAGQPASAPAPGAKAQPVATATATAKTPPSRLRHRLEDFVVGSSNQLAYAAANRMAEETGEAGSVLFLHGGCGLGKTHLLQGLCRRMLETNRAAKVHYTTGEQFTNDYIAAVRSGKLEGFRRRMRRLDLLAVDDVHFIANKPATQQEFLHSFDHLELGGARVALASDSHPKLIKQFSEALVSRCVRGLVVQIHPPDLELRQQLVQVLAGRRELVLEEGVAAALASRSGGSVREIEGALTKLQAIARLTRPAGQASAANVGHALVRQLFEHEDGGPVRPVSLEKVLDVACEQLGVTREQVMGRGRQKMVVLARSLVIHLTRQMTPMSYPEIARAFGRRTHSTVITAEQRVQKQLKQGQRIDLPGELEPVLLADLVDRLRRAVRSG